MNIQHLQSHPSSAYRVEIERAVRYPFVTSVIISIDVAQTINGMAMDHEERMKKFGGEKFDTLVDMIESYLTETYEELQLKLVELDGSECRNLSLARQASEKAHVLSRLVAVKEFYCTEDNVLYHEAIIDRYKQFEEEDMEMRMAGHDRTVEESLQGPYSAAPDGTGTNIPDDVDQRVNNEGVVDDLDIDDEDEPLTMDEEN